MTAAVTLLDSLRDMGATVTVAGDKLRIEAPDGTVTPELRQVLTEHKPELLALLKRTLPVPPADRLTPADCIEMLDEMHAGIRAVYLPGALRLLDRDRGLRARFTGTEARIDELAATPGGPAEGDFRQALEAHAAVWREIVDRHRGGAA